MPRKIQLSRTQNAVLHLLYDAGEETLGTILNTLGVRPDSQGTVPHSLTQAVEGLLRLGFVAWSPGPEPPPLEVAHYDAVSGQWSSPWAADDPVSLILTDAGKRNRDS